MLLGKDKAVEYIDSQVNNQIEWWESDDGIGEYWCCLQDYNLGPDYRLILAKAVAVAGGESFRDADAASEPSDISDDLFYFLDYRAEDFITLEYWAGVFPTARFDCLCLDSCPVGEIEIQPFNAIKPTPLFQEYYNRTGDYYMSDQGYAYATVDGSACLTIDLDGLKDTLKAFEEEDNNA